jgi:Tfp pilus assembly protein PilN
MKELDFLPASFHEAARRRCRRRRNFKYILGVTMALAGLHFVNETRIQRSEAALIRLQAGDSTRDVRRQHLQELAKEEKKLARELELISQIDDDAPTSVVIAEIVRLMDEAMGITNLHLETVEPETEGKTASTGPALTTVTLEGVTTSDIHVGQFEGRLSESRLFEDVKLHYSRGSERSGRKMREFKLTLSVRRVTITD